MSLIKKRNPKKVWYEVCFDIKEKTPTKVIDFQCFVEVIFTVVGKTGFEPATPWSQTKCATGLRYFPFLLQFAL